MKVLVDIGGALALVIGATLVGRVGGHVFSDADVVMGYLLAVLVLAYWRGYRASLVASVLSVGAYNFFFVPPFHTFAVADTRNLLTFAVLFGVGAAASTLASRLRQQEATALAREHRTATLLWLTRAVSNAVGEAEVARAIVSEAASNIAAGAALVVDERVIAQAGDIDTTTLSALHGMPATAGGERVAMLYLSRPTPDAGDLAEAYARQAGLALARARQVAIAEEATLRARTEELRSALLSTVSHDLRTPLAAITGAATALLDAKVAIRAEVREELLVSVRDEAARLERLVANLLEMTRLASGPLVPRREWVPVDELVGAAWSRVDGALGGRPTYTELASDLPLVQVDPVLFEHVLLNLLENAIRHTAPGTPVHVLARRDGSDVVIAVRDEGPGWPDIDLVRLFDPFVRGARPNVAGSGLGLAICRGIVEAHGGTIAAVRPEGGGAAVVVTLPAGGDPPEMPEEEP